MRLHRSMMIARKGVGQTPAVRIGQTQRTGGGLVTFPAGTQPGDLCVLFNPSGSPSGGSGATWKNLGSRGWCRTIDPTDLSSPFAVPNSSLLVIYRGPTDISSHAALGGQGPPGSSSVAGFAKAYNCAGRLVEYNEGSAFLGFATSAGMASFSTMTQGGQEVTLYEDLNVSGYTDGTNVNSSWDLTDGSGSSGMIFQLLN